MLATDPSLVDVATKSGPVVGLLVFILWGGMRENPLWVFGWVYRDLLKRYVKRGEHLDKWQQIAFRGTAVAEDLVKDKTQDKEE